MVGSGSNCLLVMIRINMKTLSYQYIYSKKEKITPNYKTKTEVILFNQNPVLLDPKRWFTQGSKIIVLKQYSCKKSETI